MTFEEFDLKLCNMTSDGSFSFGFNWLDYVENRVTPEIISSHMDDLMEIYKDIDNRGTLIDIGSGSGLSSLCFRKLGFNSVHSVDMDPHSITAAKVLMKRFGSGLQNNWNIFHASILDPVFTKKNKETYDVVYSWGVLHHTGDMWTAIRNAASMVRSEGYFHIALYLSGDQYTDHLRMKLLYAFVNKEEKKQLLYNYLKQYEFNGVDIFSSKDKRGMNCFNDAMDWLGGLPYEVCDPDVLNSYMWSLGFTRLIFTPGSQGGNFIVVYKKR